MKLKKSLFVSLPIFKNSKLSIWKHITLLNHPKLDRLKISKILEKKYNIFINWAYDPPLHLQPVYKSKYFQTENKIFSNRKFNEKTFSSSIIYDNIN